MIRLLLSATLLGTIGTPAGADDLPLVSSADAQPLAVHVDRLREALEHVGSPLSAGTSAALDRALELDDDRALVRLVQRALDPQCLLAVSINPESRVKVVAGPAEPVLVESGWRSFLVKVHNEAGVTAPLVASSPSASPVPGSPPDDVRHRWLDLDMFDGRPLEPRLSGVDLEYRILQLYSRDAGKRAAVIAFNVGQGTQDIGFRNDVDGVRSIAYRRRRSRSRVKRRERAADDRLVRRSATGARSRVPPSVPSASRRTSRSTRSDLPLRGRASSKLPPGSFEDRPASRGPEYVLTRQRELDRRATSQPRSDVRPRSAGSTQSKRRAGGRAITTSTQPAALHYTDPSRRACTPKDMIRDIAAARI